MSMRPTLGVPGRVAAVAGLSVLFAFLTSPLLARASTSSGNVVSLELNGVVDPFMASYVQRGLDHADSEGAAGVLLTVDTPGGLDSSMREITKAILASKIPVLCYTSPQGARAASAGTFIMMSCPVAAMAAGTNIGAAHPVGVQGAIENEKVTNDASAYIRSLAERWGRNANAAEKSVRQATSWTAQGALNTHLVDLVSPSTTALFDTAGGCPGTAPQTFTTGLLRDGPIKGLCGVTLQPFKMSLSESLFHAFADPNIAFLLINIGFLALIIWVFHPGLHVSLAIGIVSLILGFAILETLPVRLVGFVLLVVASVLFVLDVKAKAHGVLTAGGIVLLILGGLLLFNPSVPSARVSLPLLIGVAAVMGLAMLFVVRALIAAREEPIHSGLETLVGRTGTATSSLAPKGTVRARSETWSAESVAGEVAPGTPVRIVGVKGVKLLVTPDLDENGSPDRSDKGAVGAEPREGSNR